MAEPLDVVAMAASGGGYPHRAVAGTGCPVCSLLAEVERLRDTEAWDEVERLRGVVERLELEKFDLTERLMRAQEQGMGLAAAADNAPTAASRTRGQGIPS